MRVRAGGDVPSASGGDGSGGTARTSMASSVGKSSSVWGSLHAASSAGCLPGWKAAPSMIVIPSVGIGSWDSHLSPGLQ
jgi:hypothetical protein